MDLQVTANLANLAQSLASVILGGIAIWFTWRTARHDREKKRLDLEEGLARMNISLNLEAQTKAYRQGEHLFIETFVDIHNPSNKSWSIPAAYISYRALIDSTAPKPFTGREGFEDLAPCEGLRITRNRAYLADSIWTVEPDERIRLVRIDRVQAEKFQKRYPVLWVNVEVFGASCELLSVERTSLNDHGRFRRSWIDFSTSLERQDEALITIGRLAPSAETSWDDFNPGDRCILAATNDGARPDKERSVQFKAMLASISQYTVDSTVNIGEILDVVAPRSQ
jgi:hypothetical protein